MIFRKGTVGMLLANVQGYVPHINNFTSEGLIITTINFHPKPLCPQTDEHNTNNKANVLWSYKIFTKNKVRKSYLPYYGITKRVCCHERLLIFVLVMFSNLNILEI